MIQFFRLFIFINATIALFSGCAEEKKRPIRIGKGGIEYGNVFRVNEVTDARSLYPLSITEVSGFRIANQIYEGLVKFDQKTLEIVPALAKRWESTDSARLWTFTIRKGVKFHDDPCFSGGVGREVSVEDVNWCLKKLCTADANNQMFWLVEDRIVGAKEHYAATAKDRDFEGEIAGIKILNDSTITIQLNYPFAGFLQLMAHNGLYIFPQEAAEEYENELNIHAVGTGPFSLKEFKSGENVVLARNPNYWKFDAQGNQLPYLDAIQVSFVKDKKSELIKFRNGELDMIFTLPIEMYSDVMGTVEEAQAGLITDFAPQIAASMSVVYLSFQHQSEVFKDERVRQAFNLAVDRYALVTHTLQGEGTAAFNGFIPAAFPKLDHLKIRKIEFDPQYARELLAQAGYPQGKDFPELTLELSSGGTNNEIVTQVVTKMLEDNLGIKINLQVLPLAQQLDRAESGESSFWRDSWIADYPDPENFLRLFVSNPSDMAEHEKAYLNSVRYSNTNYDELYEKAIRETDELKRYDLYLAMNQIIIDQAVVMPLYYEEFTRLIPARVKNFPQNSIEYRDFSEVWISKATSFN